MTIRTTYEYKWRSIILLFLAILNTYYLLHVFQTGAFYKALIIICHTMKTYHMYHHPLYIIRFQLPKVSGLQ